MGLVAKIDLAEIRNPFVYMGGLVAVIIVVLVTASMFLTIGFSISLVGKIEEGRQKYQGLFDQVREGVFVCDREVILEVNQAVENILEVDGKELINRSIEDVLREHSTPEQTDQVIGDRIRLAMSEEIQVIQLHLKRKGGEIFPGEVSFRKIKLQGKSLLLTSICDLSEMEKAEKERLRLEKQLMRSQKMEALGNLVGGIAHDFNNILSPIIGFAELMEMEFDQEHPHREYLEHILAASLRAAGLVKQILLFCRQEREEADEKVDEKVVIYLLAKEVISLVQAFAPKNIDIKLDIRSKKGAVLASPAQIHQVLMNLCTNGCHAVEDKGGTLEVIVDRVDLDEGEVDGLDKGRYVFLQVCDTGEGIPEENLSKIYDPFFTTKELGTGTGLGLSVVHGIIQRHNGAIEVESVIGEGTTFTIYLPHVDFNEGEKKVESVVPVGEGNILIVDDEESILSWSQSALKRVGYHVITCKNGPQVIDVLDELSPPPDLLITDYFMPKMNGIELVKEIRRRDVHIPVIVISGMGESIDKDELESIGVREVIIKPVGLNELYEKVAQVLDRH